MTTTWDDDDDYWDDDDDYWAQEEPSCFTCRDRGVVPPRWWTRLRHGTWAHHRPCPSCNQPDLLDQLTHLRYRARWYLRNLLRRGRGQLDEAPF